MNPNPDLADLRVTSVGGAGSPEGEVGALIDYASVFNMTEEGARSVLSQVGKAVADWADVARDNGIAQEEIERFAPALNSCVGVVVGSAGSG